MLFFLSNLSTFQNKTRFNPFGALTMLVSFCFALFAQGVRILLHDLTHFTFSVFTHTSISHVDYGSTIYDLDSIYY